MRACGLIGKGDRLRPCVLGVRIPPCPFFGTVAQWQSVRLISEEILVQIHSVLLRQDSLMVRRSPDKRKMEVRFFLLLLCGDSLMVEYLSYKQKTVVQFPSPYQGE